MARKASAGSEAAHGFNDIIGIVLTGLSLLLLVALISYNPRDVPVNKLPPNPSTHNWIGPIGAWTAWFWFLVVGAAAYEMPALLFFQDRKSTRLNSSHRCISYAVFCLKKK